MILDFLSPHSDGSKITTAQADHDGANRTTKVSW